MAAKDGSGRPFVGRVETVEALHRRLEEVRAGTGGVTILVGDTGVGKSALIAELVGSIRARGILALVGRALALDDPPPFSLIRSAIESARADLLLTPDDARPVGGDPVLIGFAPPLSEKALPPLVSIETRLLEAIGGTTERSGRSRDRVLEGITDQFRELTRRGPTVLILEDLHRADDTSLATVEFLAEQLKDESLWILGTSRPFDSLSQSGRARLERFETVTHAREVLLRPMTSEEAVDYLRTVDPSQEFSATEVARLHSETGGNPLLLEQFVHHISSEGGVPGPPRADHRSLNEEARRVLDVAAVLGPTFTFDFLLRASGERDEERLAETVDHLVEQGLLFERPGEVLEFPEARLREETYNLLPEMQRRQLHRRAGEAMEAMGAVDVSRTYALARHFYLGHEAPRSVHYNCIAAEIDERALALDAAWDHYAHALESQREMRPEDLDKEAELILELARIEDELGLLEDAEATLRSFLDQGRDDPRLASSRRATLELFLARVLHARGDSPAAVEFTKKVLATPGLMDQLPIRVGAHHQMGQALYYEGRFAEALDHQTEALRLARDIGNERVILRAQFWRAATLAMMGETEEAVAEARAVTVARDRLGSVRDSAEAHLNFGDLLADARCTPAQRQEAIGEYAEAIRFAEKAKDPRRAGYALYKTTELLRETGRFEEALDTVRRACEILRRVGDHVGLSVSLKARAQIAMDQGAYDLAEADLTEAHRLLQGLNHTLEEIDVVLRLAQLAQLRGDRGTARGYVAELERQKLSALRPDLVEEFQHLRHSLADTRDDGNVG